MKALEIVLNSKNDVKLTAYIQDKSNEYAGITHRPAVLVLPGGGYSMCSDREADVVAMSYLNAGFNAFVLRYSVKSKEGWPAPLKDYEQAMEYVKSKKDEWGIDDKRIAVCGFSAGGHLAACAATVAKNKPAAAILGYAALKKDIVSAIASDAPIPTEKVSNDTAPCFLFATRTDNIVDITNSLEFQQQLAKCGIAFESHIYGCGSHGFSTGSPELNGANLTPRAAHWVAESIGWLEERWGKLLANGYSKPLFRPRVNDNLAESLSIYCTYEYAINFEGAKEVLGIIEKAVANFSEATKALLGLSVIDELLDALSVSKEQKEEINKKLGLIPKK